MKAILLTLLALASPLRPEDEVRDVMQRWSWTGIAVEVVAGECGEENAFYQPDTDTVVMCTELFDRPALTRWVLAHELAHAFMDQHHVPFREDTHDQERSADELAFLMSDADENTAAAKWFMGFGTYDDGVHPPAEDRAGYLLCLQAGREGWHAQCRLYYASVLAHWVRIMDGYL